MTAPIFDDNDNRTLAVFQMRIAEELRLEEQTRKSLGRILTSEENAVIINACRSIPELELFQKYSIKPLGTI